MTIDINELRRKLRSGDLIDHVDIHANVKSVLAELLDRLDAAENENAKLRIALAEKVTSEATLRDLNFGNGFINATFEGGAVQLMVDALADQFVGSGAPNYIEMQFHSNATGPLLFTLQRVDGKTPHQLRAEAEQERDALRAELSKQQALTTATQHIAEVAQSRANRLQAKITEMEQQEPVGVVQWIKGWPVVNAHDGVILEPNKPLYALPGAQAQPAPSFADAYQGAMEEVAIWKKRALEAEDINRKFIAEINGPTYMGEPAQPAPSVPVEVVDLYNFMCAAFVPMTPQQEQIAIQLELAKRAMLAAAPEAKPCLAA